MKKMKIFLLGLVITALVSVFVSVSADDGFYTVTEGDSLWRIAKGYGISLKTLMNANPQIKDPDTIFTGDKIYIPNTESIAAAKMELFELINKQRMNTGLAPLKRNDALFETATLKSEDMAKNGYFAHQSPSLGSPFSMMIERGITFSAAGENIANGHNSAVEAFNDWIASSGNKNNILSAVYSEVGIGAAKDENGTFFFTALFIKGI